MTSPSERGHDFQERVTLFFSKVLEMSLSERTLPINLPGGQNTYRADMVDEDITFVGKVKDYRWRKNGKVPNGKFAETERGLLMLKLLTDSPKRRVLVQ